jgi:hypothetical protein
MSGSVAGSASGTGMIPTGAAGSGSKAKMTPAQQNAYARQLIFRNAKPIFQKVASKTFTNVATGNNVFTVNPLQIGFVRRFLVEVTATLSNTDSSHVANEVGFGVDNLISNVTFTDFTGNPRHNASGRSFGFVEAAKYRQIPGAAFTSDSVSGYGSNVASNVAPQIAASGTATVTRVFEIPIMVDLGQNMAGGLWLGTNNQSTTLNITINPNPIGLPAADPLNLVYRLATGGTTVATSPITSCTVTVWQDYWNNVPSDPTTGTPILPQQDIGTAYLITETNSGMTFAANQQSSWNFPTFSKMLGTYFIYDNNAALNAGTDISTIALVLSNYAIVKQYDPITLDRITRQILNSSFPSGSYALITRQHPLDIDQYPALQLQVTPTSATSAVGMITTELLRPVQYMAVAAGMGGT